MTKILLIIAAVLLAPFVIAAALGVAVFAIKIALLVGLVALVVLGIRRFTGSSSRARA